MLEENSWKKLSSFSATQKWKSLHHLFRGGWRIFSLDVILRRKEEMTWRRNGFFQALNRSKTSLSEFSHLAGIDQHLYFQIAERALWKHELGTRPSFVPKLPASLSETSQRRRPLSQHYSQSPNAWFLSWGGVSRYQEELDFLHDYLFPLSQSGEILNWTYSLTSPLFSLVSSIVNTLRSWSNGRFQASLRFLSPCPLTLYFS